MDIRSTWQNRNDDNNLRFYIVLIGWAAAAIAVLWLSHRYLEGVILEVINGVGIAILSAVVLGITIHLWLELR